MKITLSEKNYLIFAKLLIIGLVAIFILGRGKHWPFIYWALYDRGNPQLPQKASRLELRVLDNDQNWQTVQLMDLYSIDDDSSRQPGATKIIHRNFISKQELWPIYHSHLLQYLEEKLNTQILQVEAYVLEWDLNYNTYPPLDLNQPIKVSKVGSFKATDYEN